jgi:hypothetical protein
MDKIELFNQQIFQYLVECIVNHQNCSVIVSNKIFSETDDVRFIEVIFNSYFSSSLESITEDTITFYHNDNIVSICGEDINAIKDENGELLMLRPKGYLVNQFERDFIEDIKASHQLFLDYLDGSEFDNNRLIAFLKELD